MIPIKEKDIFENGLSLCGYNINYVSLDEESKLDGLTFKSLEHGAKASLKGLVIKYILEDDTFSKGNEEEDFMLKSVIEYKCTKGIYKINISSKFPQISFKIYN